MSQIKFQQLIDDFSSASLVDVLKGHDYFRIKQNPLPAFSDKRFIDFNQLGDFDLEDNTNIVVICARSLTHLNERASRKAQYDISKKILKSFQKSRAGIFVYYDSKGDFRISLIYADYVGVKVNYSTFKRFTYFVSKEQTNTTFLQYVAPFSFTNFQGLKEIFSVEKVTKEFFEKYYKLFIETLDDFEKNKEFQSIVVDTNISTAADFVKKLMGQIVFLYFVQKKGWLGVRPNENWGSGDQAFLRTLFTACEKSNKNYFNDYLEPLFYKALAEKREDDDFFEELNCRIPFLNGGLFESVYDWDKTTIYIPNKTIGDLLDFFDQFNFTVDENTPSDQEISVDPEMLGKIFENLLNVKDRKDKGAFYTPREIVHYMCRESLIQHLVSEKVAPEERIRKIFEIKDTDLSVLIENEKKAEIIKKLPDLKEIAERADLSLRKVRVVDPAVGSGAFPMGMLNEISSVRFFLNSNFLHKANESKRELSLYDIKKETLENCIYAVDIEPGAVEIAKLRFWLALIVEYESNDLNIAPPTLPNLDYKIMQGNSLLEEYEGVKLFDEKLLQTPLINADIFSQENQLISKLQSELLPFYMKNPSWMKKGEFKDKPHEVAILEDRLRELLKHNKKIKGDSTEQKDLFISMSESKMIWDEIKSKHKLFFSESEKEKKKDLRRQIDKLNWQLIESTLQEQKNDSALQKLEKLKESNTKPFFLWHLYFAEVFEEKKGFDIVIGNPPYLKERDNRDIFESVNNSTFGRLYHQGKMDFWYYFLYKAMDIVRKDGFISYITPRYWLNSRGAKKLIKRIFDELSFVNFVDIGKLKVFDNVVGQHMIAIYKKTKANDSFVYKKLENDVSDINKSEDTNNLKIKKLSNKHVFTESNEIILDSERQVLSSTIPLGNIADVSQGVVEATDKVSSKQLKKITDVSEINTGDGVFVISKLELENMKLNINEKSVIKKYMDPNDIFRYGLNWDNKYLIYADGLTKNKIKSDFNFSNLKKHLDKYKKFITSSNKPYGLHRPRDSRYFTNPKIIFKGMFVENQFTYDDKGYFVGMSFSLIIQKDTNYELKYILAILNSKFANNWFYRNGKKRGAGVDIGVEKLRTFPVKIASKQEQKPFINLVDGILNITKNYDYLISTEKQTEVKNLEHQIDGLVYKLYDITTTEEIEIIENSIKK